MLAQVQTTEYLENEECTIENKNIKRQRMIIKISLYIIIISASLGSGMAMGYPAVLLPQLKSSSNYLHIDEEMGSWIASLQSIGNPLGAFVGGVLMYRIGRKPTLQIEATVLTISWLLCATCWNHKILLIGRFLGGLSSGIGMTVSPIYVAEITQPEMRGILSAIIMVSSALGIFLVYLLGSFVHWRLMAGISAIIPTVIIFLYFVLPESPVWLVRHNHLEKAKKACRWYQENDNTAEKEMEELITRSKIEQLQEKDTLYISSLLKPSIMKPLLILNAYNILQALSGWVLLVVYGVEIIQLTINSSIDQTLTAILSAGIRFIFTLCALFLFTSYGRRPIGVYSTLLTGIPALIIGMCLLFNIGKTGYFLHGCLLLYVASATIGFTTLRGIISGELLPARVRALLSSINVVIASVCFFGITKLFPFLKHLCGIHGIYLIFGISSLLASFLLWATLPETKGRTLHEIEDYFTQDNVLWVNRNKHQSKLNKSLNIMP